jgi:hypothetical protein
MTVCPRASLGGRVPRMVRKYTSCLYCACGPSPAAPGGNISSSYGLDHGERKQTLQALRVVRSADGSAVSCRLCREQASADSCLLFAHPLPTLRSLGCGILYLLYLGVPALHVLLLAAVSCCFPAAFLLLHVCRFLRHVPMFFASTSTCSHCPNLLLATNCTTQGVDCPRLRLNCLLLGCCWAAAGCCWLLMCPPLRSLTPSSSSPPYIPPLYVFFRVCAADYKPFTIRPSFGLLPVNSPLVSFPLDRRPQVVAFLASRRLAIAKLSTSSASTKTR